MKKVKNRMIAIIAKKRGLKNLKRKRKSQKQKG